MDVKQKVYEQAKGCLENSSLSENILAKLKEKNLINGFNQMKTLEEYSMQDLEQIIQICSGNSYSIFDKQNTMGWDELVRTYSDSQFEQYQRDQEKIKKNLKENDFIHKNNNFVKKYELVKTESIEHEGKTLYRIKALKDFGWVKKNDIGGYIEKESNLSQKDCCWIKNEGKVFGNAEVSGNAQILGNAQVSGNAQIFDNATIKDNAKVHGNAKIMSCAKIYDKASVSGNAEVSDKEIISGNTELKEKAQEVEAKKPRVQGRGR